jgi:hypothetical protein
VIIALLVQQALPKNNSSARVGFYLILLQYIKTTAVVLLPGKIYEYAYCPTFFHLSAK